MKSMKHSFLLVASLALAGLARSQEFKVTVDNTKEGKLILDDFRGELPIEGYSGNEIIVAPAEGRFDVPDQAKGLKPIYAAGTDNTGIGLYMEKNGNRVTLHCLLPITKSGHYKLKVPDNLALEINTDCGRGGETTISNMKNEIDMKGCHRIELKNVSGPLDISTISGGISVVFTELSKDKSISLSSVSGEVDVTLPAKSSFDLEMSTISGGMYSDFDLAPANGDMQRVGGGNLRTKVNGGGTDVRLHNISGNIYLRKG